MALEGGDGDPAVGCSVERVLRQRAAEWSVGRRHAVTGGCGEVVGDVAEGDLAVAARAGAGAFDEGGEAGGDGAFGAAEVGHEDAGKRRWVEGSVDGLVGEVVAGDLGFVAGVPDDGDVHEPRVGGVQGVPAEAELGEGRRARRGEQNVGVGEQFRNGCLVLVGLEVVRDDLLPGGEFAVVVGRGGLHEVAARRFDLRHLRPEPDEMHGCGRPGQVRREADDADALEGRCAHGWDSLTLDASVVCVLKEAPGRSIRGPVCYRPADTGLRLYDAGHAARVETPRIETSLRELPVHERARRHRQTLAPMPSSTRCPRDTLGGTLILVGTRASSQQDGRSTQPGRRSSYGNVLASEKSAEWRAVGESR